MVVTHTVLRKPVSMGAERINKKEGRTKSQLDLSIARRARMAPVGSEKRMSGSAGSSSVHFDSMCEAAVLPLERL